MLVCCGWGIGCWCSVLGEVGAKLMFNVRSLKNLGKRRKQSTRGYSRQAKIDRKSLTIYNPDNSLLKYENFKLGIWFKDKYPGKVDKDD